MIVLLYVPTGQPCSFRDWELSVDAFSFDFNKHFLDVGDSRCSSYEDIIARIINYKRGGYNYGSFIIRNHIIPPVFREDFEIIDTNNKEKINEK